MKYLVHEGKYVIIDPNCTYVVDMQIPSININPQELTLGHEAGSSDIFNITANVTYTISATEPWIGVDSSSGSDNLSVTVTTLSENTNVDPREGYVVVENTSLGLSQSVLITQITDAEPDLFIVTDGGEFEGEIT